jgi:mono/diheme cytochrome c family protein
MSRVALWLKIALALSFFAIAADMARAQAATTSDAPELYREHCVACHGEQRLGGMGPALLPESLQRVKPAEATTVIAKGRQATQMPGFANKLSAEQIGALTKWI